MKMVVVVKYVRVERELKLVRVYGIGFLGKRRLLFFSYEELLI